MPFWRRNRNETAPEREVGEPVDPDFVDPSWEPDPADFGDAADGVQAPDTTDALEPEAPAERVDPLLPFDAPPPSVMTIDIPTPAPTPEQPVPAWAEPVRDPEPAPAAPPESPPEIAAALDAGLERTRGGFMARLRGQLGTATEAPSWDDVEESLIAGDVGAALAIDLVERARRNRVAANPEAAIRQEQLDRYDAALARLSEQERALIVARVEVGLTYEEMAEALGKPSWNAARMATARALLRLAEELKRGQ